MGYPTFGLERRWTILSDHSVSRIPSLECEAAYPASGLDGRRTIPSLGCEIGYPTSGLDGRWTILSL